MYFADHNIEIQKNLLSISEDNEQLLALFAYSYPEVAIPLKGKHLTNFSGEKIMINCYMIAQDLNIKFDKKFLESK